ncbi:hypothetical protein AAF712_004711 [Marasmius tenuissimus]|uniref:Uncharacterized protein n=1 Tax=Marasmius tenuissimus TaxID=585030 RepID=A0ABR3A4R2_9AGAR
MRLSLFVLSSPIIIGSTLAAPSAERITQLFAPLATGDAGPALDQLLFPNITWTVLGSALNGTYNLTGIKDIISTVSDAISGTYKIDTVSVISEGAEGTRSSIELKAAEGTVGKNGMESSRSAYNQD